MKTRTNDVVGEYVVAHGEYDAKQKKWVMEFNGKLFEVGKSYYLVVEGSIYDVIQTLSSPCTNEKECGFIGIQPSDYGVNLFTYTIKNGEEFEFIQYYKDLDDNTNTKDEPVEGQTITIYEIG